jgi:hypothetical protein
MNNTTSPNPALPYAVGDVVEVFFLSSGWVRETVSSIRTIGETTYVTTNAINRGIGQTTSRIHEVRPIA